ncbi:uncharacterized protein [Acropora muricata]|uniref:uncharacterized protein n=1 Tax=Acropora muricata TaxID=159855 RepID=UPI0034E380AC
MIASVHGSSLPILPRELCWRNSSNAGGLKRRGQPWRTFLVSMFGNFQFETEGNKTLPDEQEAGTEETKKAETKPGGAENCRRRGKGSKNKKNKRDKKNKKPRLTEDNE